MTEVCTICLKPIKKREGTEVPQNEETQFYVCHDCTVTFLDDTYNGELTAAGMKKDQHGFYTKISYEQFWDAKCLECGKSFQVYEKAYKARNGSNGLEGYRCKNCLTKQKVAKIL